MVLMCRRIRSLARRIPAPQRPLKPRIYLELGRSDRCQQATSTLGQQDANLIVQGHTPYSRLITLFFFFFFRSR